MAKYFFSIREQEKDGFKTVQFFVFFLSGNGLKASANSGNYDNSGDLIGYWKFNEGTGSTLTDNTSNSNNGTLTNMDSSDWVTSGSETKPSFQ